MFWFICAILLFASLLIYFVNLKYGNSKVRLFAMVLFAYTIEALLLYSGFCVYKHINEYHRLKNRVAVLEKYYSIMQSKQDTLQEIKNVICKFNSNLYDVEAESYAFAVYRLSRKLNLDWRQIVGLGGAESLWNPMARSRYAIGVLQVNPRVWSRVLGFNKYELYNPIRNLIYGSRIWKHYLERTDGDIKKALVLYSGGTSNPMYYETVLELAFVTNE